jgi:3-hydroxyacyl-[acyl-carrier-protein] dehydratase
MTVPRRGLEAADILAILPHRPPFLLVDRVVEVEPGARIHAIKNVTASEPWIAAHFPPPGRPVMPGVLIIEALAQAGALLVHATEPFAPDAPLALLGVDRARFHRPIVPGDAVELWCEIAARRGGVWRLRARAMVAGQLAAEATLLAAVGPVAGEGP